MFKRNTTTKLGIASLFLVLGLAVLCMFGLFSNPKAKAEGEEGKIALRVGPKLSTYTGYSRYEGINFIANGATDDLTFTSSETTAFVYKVKLCNSASTAYAFYLNGQLNTGASATPTHTSLYKGSEYVGETSHGAYSVGYYNAKTDFDYIVVPTTNFSNAAKDTSVTISNVSIAIRLQGVASNKIEYATANMDVFGIYLATDFVKEQALNVAGLKTIYTPASDSISNLDTGNSGITPDCIIGEYRTKITPTLTSDANGSLEFVGDAWTNEENCQINVTPNEGYELDTLTVNDVDVTENVSDNKYVFKAGTTISANATFKLQEFSVTKSALHGTLSSDKEIVKYGENVTFSWTVDENCTFSSLKINDEAVQTTGNSYVLENVKGDVKAELVCRGSYVPTIASSEHGTVGFPNETYSDGDDITFTITPDEGYELDTLTVNGTDKTADVSEGKYVLENAPQEVNVSATFKIIELTVQFEEMTNGTVTTTTTKFNYGSDVVLTITPAEGFALSELTINGVKQDAESSAKSFTVLSAKENLVVSAKFLHEAKVVCENGKVLVDMYEVGDDLLIELKPNPGYKFVSLKVNGTEAKLNKFGQYLLLNAPQDLTLEGTFEKLEVFELEAGSMTSIYNQYKGTVVAEFDAVNVQLIKSPAGVTAYKWVGVTVDGLDKAVTSTDFIAVQVHNLDATWRTFHIEVNGTRFTGTYYLVDRLGNIQTKNADTQDKGAITERYTYFKNATWNPGSSHSVEGFAGYIIMPITNFGEVTKIESVSVYSGFKEKSNPRFNVGEFAILSSFDPRIASDIKEEDVFYTPTATNFKPYVDGETDNTSEYCKLQFLEKDEFAIAALDQSVDYNYDVLYVTFPQSMIGEDGYVDLAALGIKGIVFDVLNENDTQHFFTFRLAGADNVSLTDTSKSMWQGSQSSATSAQKVIYQSGLVRTRASAFLAYDESGLFDGTVYIPFSAAGFGKIGGNDAEFPTKIHPVLRILLGSGKTTTDESVYDVKISNIRFITDDTPYSNYLITLIGSGAVIDAKIGDKTVGRDSNNRVVPGTELVIDVTPNLGYKLNSVKATIGESTQTLTKGEDGKYHITVTGDVLINVDTEEIEYTITYELDGGTNNVLNRSVYYVSDETLTLNPATKEGYRFIGWVDEEGAEVDEIDCTLAKNITLTAVFEKNSGGDEPVDPVTQAPKTTGNVTETPVTPTDAPSKTSKTKRGCKGALVPSIIGISMILSSVIIVSVKRRKED